jgi:hypothetical protein
MLSTYLDNIMSLFLAEDTDARLVDTADDDDNDRPTPPLCISPIQMEEEEEEMGRWGLCEGERVRGREVVVD